MEKLQYDFSKEMIRDSQEWKQCLTRCNTVYGLYCENSTYMFANRVYSANKALYKSTEKVYNSDEQYKDLITLLNHLDDWFIQFEELKQTKPRLKDEFVFKRESYSVSYPTELIQNYLKAIV